MAAVIFKIILLSVALRLFPGFGHYKRYCNKLCVHVSFYPGGFILVEKVYRSVVSEWKPGFHAHQLPLV